MSDYQDLQDTRVTRAVLSWADFYGRHVTPSQGKARREELISDMYEQQADALRRGVPAKAVNRSIAFRAVRGIFADITWSRIHNDPEVRTMATSRKADSTDRPLTSQVTAVLWTALVALAAIGLGTSITEMIDTGGQRHGYTPWPGAANISLTLVVLIGSAAALAFTAIAGALKWRHHNRAT
ncbi:hypothetical protein M1D88_00780 [Arthrobacter sp. R1-13]